MIILAGVVVAVAMTEIVGAWGRILRTEAKVKPEPLFIGWTCYVLLLSMWYWIAMWQYQAVEFVYLGQVWMLVLPILFLVLVAFALTPNVPAEGELDLRSFYFSRRRRVFYPLAIFVLCGGVARVLIGDAGSYEDHAVAAIWIGCYLILTVTEKPAVHWIVLILLLLNMLIVGFHEIQPTS